MTIIGLVPILNGAIITWAMPSIFRVVLSGGGIAGAVWMIILVILDGLMFYPFFRIMDKQYSDEEQKASLTPTQE